jgi:hypothetical protein
MCFGSGTYKTSLRELRFHIYILELLVEYSKKYPDNPMSGCVGVSSKMKR